MPVKTQYRVQGAGYSERTETLRVASPAKVNLYLGVTGTRADGYHDLATIFERVALADELELSPQAEGITCTCDAAEVPSDARNLVVRAAQLLQARCGIARGVHIAVKKRIPVAAGLGGGSSNAAMVLMTLNRWWELGLPLETLMQLGRELGADVPFFLADAAFALGVNRGDVIVPLPVKPSLVLWHVLVTPPTMLMTAEVFRAWDTLGSAAGMANVSRLARLLTALLEGDAAEACGLTWNQLAPAASQLAPVIRDVEDALAQAGATSVSLTGSGPTVIATLMTEDDARRIASHVEREHPEWQVIVTRTASQACER